MKTSTLKKDSWHWRLAHKYGSARLDYWQDKWTSTSVTEPTYKGDFCSYARHVLTGALVASLFTIFFSLMVGAGIDFFMWIYVNMRYGRIDIPLGAAIFVTLVSCIALCGILILISISLTRIRMSIAKKVDAIEEPGFFTLLYRKLKDKTCFNVEIQ